MLQAHSAVINRPGFHLVACKVIRVRTGHRPHMPQVTGNGLSLMLPTATATEPYAENSQKYNQLKQLTHTQCGYVFNSHSTETVSSTVSARNNVGSVLSRNIFCSGAGTCWFTVQKVGMWPMGESGE